MSKIVGYAPGAYDLFHIGHLNILRHARTRCDHLIAGVVSDEMCLRVKGQRPFIPASERMEIVRHIDFVDEVFLETLPEKLETWRELRFDRIFKGDDWRGTEKGAKLEADFARVGVEVVYFPYTVHTSSTKLRRALMALTDDLQAGASAQ
jgi:glycerol-3-phosphate cytidylyltransferase